MHVLVLVQLVASVGRLRDQGLVEWLFFGFFYSQFALLGPALLVSALFSLAGSHTLSRGLEAINTCAYFRLVGCGSVVLFGLFPHLLFSLMLRELLHILIQLGLVMGNILLIVLFLFNQMLTLRLNLINLILLVLDSLLIRLLQVLNPFFKQFIFLQQLLVFLLL